MSKVFNMASMAKMQRQVAAKVAAQKVVVVGNWTVADWAGKTVKVGTVQEEFTRAQWGQAQQSAHGQETFVIETGPQCESEYENLFERFMGPFHICVEVGYDFKGKITVMW